MTDPRAVSGRRRFIRPWATYAVLLAVAGVLGCTGQVPARPAAHQSAASQAAGHRSQAAGRAPARAAGISEVSRGCPGANAEPISAAAPNGYVYLAWIGCGGIGFARSTDGGAHFGAPTLVPGSRDVGPRFSWDPSVAAGPDGKVYVAYMFRTKTYFTPVVAASSDHGVTFPQVHQVAPNTRGNFGDRDFIAVGPSGKLFLTWDYGPDARKIKTGCAKHGSCYFTAGDVNAVIQTSVDSGKTWSRIAPVAPGFPRNGGVSAPLVVRPGGRVDVLYWGHRIGSPPADKLHAGHEFFTASPDGKTWPRYPREIFPGRGSIALPTWWIDGSLAVDSAGTLYATWDTQSAAGDTGWLTWSANDGGSWAKPVRVTGSGGRAMHLMQATGAGRGLAYVGWQTSASHKGYGTYVRLFSIRKGWIGKAIRVSPLFGNAKHWPGDTIGLARPAGHRGLSVAWGSAVGTSRFSEIWATVVH